VAKKPATRALVPAPGDLAEEIAAGGERKVTAVAWVLAVTERADQGDKEALKLALEAHQAVPRLWPKAGVLRDNAERSILDALLREGRQPFTRATIEHQLDQMRADLCGENPTPLERILVDRVVLCWLDAMYADTVRAQRLAGDCSFRQAEFFQRRAEAAQRQFLRAVTTLATVRRLTGPVVQLNVAQKQINLAG